MRTAPNVVVPFSVNISGYPVPRVDRVRRRTITVSTSLGPRPATEVTITGAFFAIRAVSPEVRVNGLDLVSFRIANDTKSITGYLFEDLRVIHHVVIDYGLGARGEWWRRTRHGFALIVLFVVILLALTFLALGVAPLIWIAVVVAAAIAAYVAFF